MAEEMGDTFTYWLLDVRKTWRDDNKLGSKITTTAASALQYISPSEQEKAAKFYWLRDAVMSVASSLLKRLFVVQSLEIPWSSVQFSRSGDAKHGKPCYVPTHAGHKSIDFNVSHQAGLVALAGCCCASDNIQLGVDVVCVTERNNATILQEEGFEVFVDMHAEVFSDEDIAAMKSSMVDDVGEESLDGKMRRFYAYWALKEAYVKLNGEALLAPWLKDVVFRKVRIPRPRGKGEKESEVVGEIQVWLRGKRRNDVEMFLGSYGADYMIATALKKPEGLQNRTMPRYIELDLERHVLLFATPV